MPPRCLQNLGLVVSELVTNALVHSGLDVGGMIRLTVNLFPGHVRVEVTDAGGGFARRVAQASGAVPELDDHGYGLLLVERLADRWGIERRPETMVWAEIPFGGRNSPGG
jgi:anti-sigma regulatory factor (Ser/Thr protein kinase)